MSRKKKKIAKYLANVVVPGPMLKAIYDARLACYDDMIADVQKRLDTAAQQKDPVATDPCVKRVPSATDLRDERDMLVICRTVELYARNQLTQKKYQLTERDLTNLMFVQHMAIQNPAKLLGLPDHEDWLFDLDKSAENADSMETETSLT